jgi:hypothetical protein
MVPSPLKLGIAAICATLLAATAAEAHRNGIASQGCDGCHSGGAPPTVTITASVTPISPGETLTLSVNIATSEGWAGLFMQTDVGTLTSLAGQGTQPASGGITHTMPKQAVNGVATFKVGWTAPGSPGGVNINVWAVAANNDGSPHGDGAGTGFESFAIGCGTGTLYYRDFDGDNYGADSSGYTRNCSKPMYYATVDGDCNDSDPTIYPGAPEICDSKDNNCDGLIDNGTNVELCGAPDLTCVSGSCLFLGSGAPDAGVTSGAAGKTGAAGAPEVGTGTGGEGPGVGGAGTRVEPDPSPGSAGVSAARPHELAGCALAGGRPTSAITLGGAALLLARARRRRRAATAAGRPS